MVKRGVCLVLLTAVLAIPAFAQATGIWEISTQMMYSPNASTPGSVFGGQSSGVSQSAVAVRATTDLLRLGALRLRYSAQLLPAIRLGDVEQYARLEAGGPPTYILAGTRSAYGIGFVPLGLDLAAHLGPRARLQVGAGVGIAGFTQHVPFAGSRRRNFTAEWDGLLMLHAGGERWVQVGLRWKHISNGNTAWENPGIDNRMVFAGMSWRVRAPR